MIDTSLTHLRNGKTVETEIVNHKIWSGELFIKSFMAFWHQRMKRHFKLTSYLTRLTDTCYLGVTTNFGSSII